MLIIFSRFNNLIDWLFIYLVYPLLSIRVIDIDFKQMWSICLQVSLLTTVIQFDISMIDADDNNGLNTRHK